MLPASLEAGNMPMQQVCFRTVDGRNPAPPDLILDKNYSVTAPLPLFNVWLFVYEVVQDFRQSQL